VDLVPRYAQLLGDLAVKLALAQQARYVRTPLGDLVALRL